MTDTWRSLARVPATGAQAFRRSLPRTLFGRSMAIIMTPLVLMLVISVFVFFDRHWDSMTRRLAHSLAGDVSWVADALVPIQGEAKFHELADRAHRLLDMKLAWKPGANLMAPRQALFRGHEEQVLAAALSERVRVPFLIDPERRDRRLVIWLGLEDRVLEIEVSRKRLYTSTHYIFLLWMCGSSLVLFAIAIIFMRNQIRPIRRLAAAAHAFGKGRSVGDFRAQGATEVRQAAEAFQLMRERITRQLTQRTEMLAGVSHDLRGPLTSMKLSLAMLPDNPEVEGLKGDVRQMESMVEGFLDFARGEGTERTRVDDMVELLREVVGSGNRNGGSIALTETVSGPELLEIRPEAMRRAIGNLVDNAIRHASHVFVTLEITEASVTVTVDDDGPGIPPQEYETVFRPFYRLDQSRNPGTGGVGLGLAIARDVARSHGGDVTTGCAPQGGSRFTLRFPV
ncbi:MAG: ATP-binding protein [Alphaproteobacteria bacterium]|nr:ATP-binding protein [Alphaproteobacteria bacterium]